VIYKAVRSLGLHYCSEFACLSWT